MSSDGRPELPLRPGPGQRALPAERMFLVFESALAVSLVYLLGLLLAALGSREELAGVGGIEDAPFSGSRGTPSKRLRLVVLVPAHDEEMGIAATLASLALCDYPSELYRTVVIADNCGDATARRAREAGVEAWERVDPRQRGKGHALSWAIERLQADAREFDGVLVIDADCTVSPNMLSAIDATLRTGAEAAQVACQVANPEASDVSALRYASFVLMNTVRPLGKRRLGLSCGLFGTGVAFTRGLLARRPWAATGLAEDGEYHLRLVDAGERVEFIPGAWVRSAMPTTLRTSAQQQARWEQGKLDLIRHWSPRLAVSGLVKRDLVRVHAALEHLVPPQSLIAAGSTASALAGLLMGSRRLLRLSGASLAAQLIFVLAGLRLVRAPAHIYRALAIAPILVVAKVALYARLIARGGPKSWVRTERETRPAGLNG